MEKVFNKLVRDKIPDLMASSGVTVTFKSLHGEKLRKALKDKLIEETQEVVAAESYDKLLEELADVSEVVEHLLRVHGFSKADLEKAMADKRICNGSFLKGYFLEKAEDVENG